MSEDSPAETAGSDDDTADDETTGSDAAGDEGGQTPHEQMEQYVEFAAAEQEARRENQAVLDQVSEAIAEAAERTRPKRRRG